MFRAIIIFLSLFLTACTTLNYVPPSPATGLFPTDFQVSKDEIKVNQPIDLKKYNRLLVVGMKNSIDLYYDHEQKFWLQSISSLNKFKNVVSVDDLGAFLIRQGYGDKVNQSNPYDLIGLHKLQDVYGNFLVADISSECEGYACQVTFKIIDPKNAKIYFMINRQVQNFAGLDPILYYPILNSFSDWLKNSNNE